MILLVIIVLAGVPGLARCADNAADPQEFEAAVKATFDKYSASMIAGDVDQWISLWDDNSIQLPREEMMIEGKARLKEVYELGFNVERYEIFNIQISKTFVDHEYGFAYGNFSFRYVHKASGVKINRYGKWETIFKRQSDGSWKIFLDCSNYNS